LSPSVRPHNLATRFRPPSVTVVSAEPFSHGTGTLRCLQKEMATYRHWSVSLWRDPDDVPHCRILSPGKTEWRLISFSTTHCGWRRFFVADQWPVMVHDTHTGRRRLSDVHTKRLRQRPLPAPSLSGQSKSEPDWSCQHRNESTVCFSYSGFVSLHHLLLPCCIWWQYTVSK